MGQNNVDWLIVSPLSGNGNGVISITASTYSESVDRYATLKAYNSEDMITATTDIVQSYNYDYDNNYTTFKILTAGTICFGNYVTDTPNSSVQYSLNKSSWLTLSGSNVINVQAGDEVRFKTLSKNVSDSFSGTAYFDVVGNALSLVYGDNFTEYSTIETASTEIFSDLFRNSNVVHVDNFTFGSDNIPASGCWSTFYGCASLVSAPKLQATVLGDDAYRYMFYGCSSLKKAPTLPSTTLSERCYYEMFKGCSSLEIPCVLPATQMKSECYKNMFNGCNSLLYAPELPATRLDSGCYDGMFSNCLSIQSPPALPATELYDSCYRYMFYLCSGLTVAPNLPATALTNYCYEYMFAGCTSLTETPLLPAPIIQNHSYYEMFYNCTNLSKVTCLATNLLYGTSSNYRWLYGVAASGLFIKSPFMGSWPTGVNGIPSGWTVQDA